MLNNYYQKHKEKLQKKAYERYENLSEEEIEYEKRFKKDIKILLKKMKKGVRNTRRGYLTIE